ncbi:MAG: DUF3667 domain-containing protein [Bacteroidota bacterium]
MIETSGQESIENNIAPRITTQYIWNEVLKTLSWEKGFFFTAKELLLKPGATIRVYLQGERKKYSNPLRFLVFVTAAVTLLTINLDLFGQLYRDTGTLSAEGAAQQMQNAVKNFIYQYFNIITFLSIPLLAVLSYLFFRRRGYNYAEHLVVNTFLTTEGMLLYLLIVPGLFYYPAIFNLVYQLTWLAYFVWGFTSFLQERSWKGVIKIIFFCLLSSFVMMLLGVIISVFYSLFQNPTV